ncbi:MAG: 4-hydroxy-3-polyprenylbenzoate decarboxylase [Candidatus Omnitrophota bacterium]
MWLLLPTWAGIFDMLKQQIVLGITGGSGAPIALRLIQLLSMNPDIHLSLLLSDNARKVFQVESGVTLGESPDQIKVALEKHLKQDLAIEIFDSSDMGASISSGSRLTKCMIIAPCSMSTLGAVANGLTMNLIHRVASVMLKEKRPLITVPRESPLSPIHLKNMLELSRCGVHVVPATIAFYHQPKSIEDMIDFVCLKVLDLAGVEHSISQRWKG